MGEPLRIFQAFLAPAPFVSAISLLVLSVNVRLMGIVNRFRQYSRATELLAARNLILSGLWRMRSKWELEGPSIGS